VPGRVLVIAGPGGVGKGTLVQALAGRVPGLFVSVSVTTRAPRPGEVDGVAYHFLTPAQFDRLAAAGGLLEWARFAGACYGTPRQPVVDAVAVGRPVILEIDLQGARQVRATMPEAVQVFIAPPSWDVLRERLIGRGTDSPERIEARLAVARTELAARGEFDRVIVNDEVDRAVNDLVELINGRSADGARPGDPGTPGVDDSEEAKTPR